jgi:hypothetical protein
MSNGGGAVGHLDIGGVFAKTTEIYKRTFVRVWVVALILMVPAGIIQALLGDDGAGQWIGQLVNLIASAWLIGSLVKVVEDVEVDGRIDRSVGDVLGSVLPRLLGLIVLQIIVAIIVGVGLLLLIIPGIILYLVLVAAVPAFVVEERGVFDSMSRSAELTKGNRMRILGVGLVVLAIWIAVGVIAALLIALSPIIGVLALIVASVALYPYVSIITAVLYFRLRELKGGARSGPLGEPAAA